LSHWPPRGSGLSPSRLIKTATLFTLAPSSHPLPDLRESVDRVFFFPGIPNPLVSPGIFFFPGLKLGPALFLSFFFPTQPRCSFLFPSPTLQTPFALACGGFSPLLVKVSLLSWAVCLPLSFPPSVVCSMPPTPFKLYLYPVPTSPSPRSRRCRTCPFLNANSVSFFSLFLRNVRCRQHPFPLTKHGLRFSLVTRSQFFFAFRVRPTRSV